MADFKFPVTRLNWVGYDWKRVKNHCRTTTNQKFTDKEATEEFKSKLLISEHTPIRLLEFDWSWEQMPYWVHAELARHKFEKFISSQRDDRLIDDIPRGKKPQDAPVSFDGYANAQNLIEFGRKRLCKMATKEARSYAMSLKWQIGKEGYKKEADVLVPNCVYRMGCPEFSPCGFFGQFLKMAYSEKVNCNNIQNRYDLYNRMFEAEVKEIMESEANG